MGAGTKQPIVEGAGQSPGRAASTVSGNGMPRQVSIDGTAGGPSSRRFVQDGAAPLPSPGKICFQ
jgi:hypothetical protein